MRPSPSLRSLLGVIGIGALVLLGSACERTPRLAGEQTQVQVLIPSDRWQAGTDDDEAARVAALTSTLDRLREETSSGWVGRQDDVTGYLGDLRGGSFPGADGDDPSAAVVAFLEGYAVELFGVEPAELVLPDDLAIDTSGFAAVRVRQHVEDVPVTDAVLVITVADAEREPRVTALLGRVFPDLDVTTTPELDAEAARAAAERHSGGEVVSPPQLTVLPDAGGRLCWEMNVVGGSRKGEGEGASADVYFIDAATGDVAAVRPTSPEFAAAPPGAGGGRAAPSLAQAAGDAVSLTGTDPYGREHALVGTLRGDGRVQLVDTTTPYYDPATGEGAITTHDASGLSQGSLPGPIITADGASVPDAEAVAAHAYARYVVDYFGSAYGWESWDGAGGTLQSSVHFGRQDECNAFFDGRGMVYGEDCVSGGNRESASMVGIDVAGHEITHGVNGSSATLLYTGQTGSLNESFADYFGNVIGDAYNGRDSNAAAEELCTGITPPTSMCTENPDGTVSLRYMANGAAMGDYLSLLDLPPNLEFIVGLDQDHGGVHINSAVWNNTLWTIRQRLAQIDGTSMLQSPRAQAFDRVVFAALTRHLTPAAGFLEGRTAIEAAAVELGAEPVVLDTVREVFDLQGICAGCGQLARGPAVALTVDDLPQHYAIASGDGIAWLENEAQRYGATIVARDAAGATTREDTTLSSALAFAGDVLVSMRDRDNQVMWHAPGESPRPLGPAVDFESWAIGVVGSPVGAAWIDLGRSTLAFVDPQGQVTTTRLPDAVQGQTIVAIGTGGSAVVVGSGSGMVLLWRVGSDPVIIERGGRYPVLGVATDGTLVAAATADLERYAGEATVGPVFVYDANGDRTQISNDGAPFGIAVDDGYVVWAQVTEALTGVVAEVTDTFASDTALYLYSAETRTTYNLFDQSGQQGFPVLSGNRLVWLDSVNFGNDVITGIIPPGL